MGKRGLPHGARRLLGYHVSRKDVSLVIYSRDALAAPLRLMCEMIREIKAKIFRPDVTRSGMLSEAPPSKELPPEVPEILEPVHSDSSEGSADEEDDEATDEEKAVALWLMWRALGGPRRLRWIGHVAMCCIRELPLLEGDFLFKMSLADSEAVFKARATACGLADGDFAKLKAEGLETMGMFAFSCNFAPGAASEAPFVELVEKVLGNPPTVKQLASFRRLFAESYSAVASDIKTQIETTDESVARKLPAADRAQRLKEQQSRISGFQIRGPYEPGDSLVDRSVQMLEQDRLSYLEWGSCVSREHELTTNTRKDNSVTFDNNGLLRMAKRDKITPCDSSSELQVRYCLMRRGLALDQAGILTYDLHESLIEKLFQARLTVPPPNYSRVQMTQLEHADRKFFALLGEHTRAGIKASAAGRPCDLAFKLCLECTDFLTLLQPRPFAVQNYDPPRKWRKFDDNKGGGKGKDKGGKDGGKGKDKGRQGSSDFARVPRALLVLGCIGMHPQTKQRFCYNFNLKTCQEGANCTRGAHMCAVKGCHQAHAAMDCPRKKTS
ncbi:unnamed protein product [Symbiodinium sp. CCMP2456]|nr:unnamed protein product [Symbiodinium sp. CCMP2456]